MSIKATAATDKKDLSMFTEDEILEFKKREQQLIAKGKAGGSSALIALWQEKRKLFICRAIERDPYGNSNIRA